MAANEKTNGNGKHNSAIFTSWCFFAAKIKKKAKHFTMSGSKNKLLKN